MRRKLSGGLLKDCLVLKKVDTFCWFVRDTIYTLKLILDAVYSINFVMEMKRKQALLESNLPGINLRVTK